MKHILKCRGGTANQHCVPALPYTCCVVTMKRVLKFILLQQHANKRALFLGMPWRWREETRNFGIISVFRALIIQ